MSKIDPNRARQFAVEVVQTLRAKGHEALWAGGCVRDFLLGREPKDYDVATSAEPAVVREVFGKRKTLAIGAAFGVIAVRGPRGAGQIEVATFRRDATYSDGRHPDSVTFSTAEEDAQRRDFTINGLFYDPVGEQVIDYVGGRYDLEKQVVRAIGDPAARIAEDKLRMLRAVRFAATFAFQLHDATLAAVQQQAHELVIVSAERVADELRKMLVHQHRRRAVELLRASDLLTVVFPEAEALLHGEAELSADDSAWRRTLRVLDALNDPPFAVALAAVVREFCRPVIADGADVQTICRRLKLANAETEGAARLLAHEEDIRGADRIAWPRLQRLLTTEFVDDLLAYGEAVCRVVDGSVAAIEHCRAKLALPREQLDPPALVNGDDLRAAGISPGPAYRELLEAVRDEQLEGRLKSKSEALRFVEERQRRSSDKQND